MRNARSRSTFKPRWRQRTSGKASKQQTLLKGVTSSATQETYDSEVNSWISRIDAAGGAASNVTIDALNTFLRTIKASSGLRDKIKRLNLFCGSNLSSALTPIIADVGAAQDTNNNFSSSEYSTTKGITNSTASGNKYLDTGTDFAASGITFTDGHIAVNTLGANTSSSYKEWIGRDHASIGSNTSSGKHHFRWGEHLLETDNTNPQSGTSMGFYLGNASASEVSLSLNGYKKITKAISSNSPSNAVDKNFYVFKRNTVFSAPNDFDRTVNFYSIGTNLTDDEAKVLYDAVTAFNHSISREVFDAQDVEVWRWANHRIQEVVGDASLHFSGALVQSADNWMLDIKSYQIRDKISRANLFLGSSSSSYGYLSALVPLIIDSGNRTDVNNGFVNSDFNFTLGLVGNGVNKFLDTGAPGNQGHLTVTSTTAAENSTVSQNINALIGSLENTSTLNAGGLSINLSQSKVYSWTHALSASADTITSIGSFAINISSLSTQELYANGDLLSTNTSSLSEWVVSGNRTISVFALNSEVAGGATAYSKQAIKDYTIGDILTAQNVKDLNAASSSIVRTELTATNNEVYNWANTSVPANGGELTQREVDAADAWMTKIKSVSGLQDKIKRANLMVGSDLKTKLVPIVSTLGNEVDSSTSIEDKNTNVKGVLGGRDRKIETGLKLSELITDSAGHFSVQQARNFFPTDNAHGVITSDATKPNFGFKFTNSSVQSYVFNSANPASYDLTFTPSTSDTIPLSGGTTYGSSTSYSWGINQPSVGNIIADYVATSTGLFNATTSANLGGRHHYLLYLYIYVNGVFVDRAAQHGSYNGSTRLVDYTLDFSVNVRKGDKITVALHRAPSYGALYGGVFINVPSSNFAATYSVPVDEDLSGLLTVSRESNTSLKLYANKVLKNTSTTAPSGSIVNRDDFVYLLGSYSDDGSLTNDFRGTSVELGFYSAGDSLTQAQVEGLNDAYTAFETALKRGLDEEAWDWAYNRVPSNGGTINDSDAEKISTFMTSLKATSGLREAIKRLNIFGGADLFSGMVPLIKDAGSDLETNYNFTSSDIDQGINASTGKYLDLGTLFTDITDASFQNFHISASVKGVSLPSTTTAYVLGNSNIKLDLNSSTAKLNYATKTVTSSSTGPAFWIASQETSATNLYKNGTSTGSGTSDGTGSNDGANKFILFGSQTENGAVANFVGRLSLYSLGTALTSAQQTAFTSAVSTLETALKRGNYSASTDEAWTWANVNVPNNSGTITQIQVDAVDKFMTSVNNIPKLRSSIKRMNLFVGDDLSAALVPVVCDLGSTADTNIGFVSGDYTASGLSAGLTTNGSKALDTTVTAASGLANNHWHMSYRSPDGLQTAVGRFQPIMGAARGYNITAMGNDSDVPYYALGVSGTQQVTLNKKENYVADFQNPLQTYQGCEINQSSITISEPNKLIAEADCENTREGVCNFSGESPTVNNKIYRFAESQHSLSSDMSSSQTLFATSSLVNFNKGVSDKSKGLYTLKVSNISGSATNYRTRLYKDGGIIQEANVQNLFGSSENDEIALFASKGNGVYSKASSSYTVNFYCFGHGDTLSSSPDPLFEREEEAWVEDFLPEEMNHFLNQLDRDLDRGRWDKDPNVIITQAGGLDSEVADWANNRVARAGGRLDNATIDAVDTFMKSIKSVQGLRQKISRLNLFAGSNLNAALVPLIADKGHPVDVNKGTIQFTESDFNLLTGLTANTTDGASVNTQAEKYLDTGLKAEGVLTLSAGHIAFATSDADISSDGAGGLAGSVAPISMLAGEAQYGNTAMNFFTSGSSYNIYLNSIFGNRDANAINGEWTQLSTPANFPKNQLLLLQTSGGLSPYVSSWLNGYRRHIQYGQRNATSGTMDPNSTLTLFAKAFGKLASHDANGGLIIPSRASITPSAFDRHKLFALTEEEYTLENLINPSGFSKTEIVNKYIKEKYGQGWRTATYNEIVSLLAFEAEDNGFNLTKLLQDFKHNNKYDKPIGWIDILNDSGRASSISGYETRLLFHNNKVKGLNSHYYYSTDSSSQTAIRNVSRNKRDKACPSCGLAETKAPLLIVADPAHVPSAGLFNVLQSWNKSVSFYSAGANLDTYALNEALNQAYKNFATTIGRSVST